MPENSNLIPIGKYKGQPIEVLAEDKQYTDWLVAQPWFRERYGNLYAVIINNFCEPSDTPEHNALQARFLDDGFRRKFTSAAFPRLWWYCLADGEMIQKAIECSIAIDGQMSDRWDDEKQRRVPHKITTESFAKSLRPFHTTRRPAGKHLYHQSPVIFEEDGVDAFWKFVAGIGLCRDDIDLTLEGKVGVEIKPEVADDYPSILRQMRRNGSRFMFTRAYTGIGVDQPTFIQYMDSQGIRVIFEHEVDAADDLRVDEFNADSFFEAVKAKIRESKSCP